MSNNRDDIRFGLFEAIPACIVIYLILAGLCAALGVKL